MNNCTQSHKKTWEILLLPSSSIGPKGTVHGMNALLEVDQTQIGRENYPYLQKKLPKIIIS